MIWQKPIIISMSELRRMAVEIMLHLLAFGNLPNREDYKLIMKMKEDLDNEN